jgi:hypothetical protein
MSASDPRAAPNLKILLALPGASTHVPNDTLTEYVAGTWVEKSIGRPCQRPNMARLGVSEPSSKLE